MRRLLGVLLLAGVMLAGCGDDKGNDDIATAGNPAAGGASPSPTMDNAERGRKFAQCMRENGIAMEDPEIGENGEFKVKIGGPGGPGKEAGPMDKTKADAAMKACQQYMPNGGAVGKIDPEMVDKMRKYAVCMRANGATEFPDPDENGMIRLERNPANDAAFTKAEEKCKDLQPKMRTQSK